MPYKNIFLYHGEKLGASFSQEDDPYKALAEGRQKAIVIAKILAMQVKGVRETDIEIQCWSYDPQYHLFKEMFPKEQIEASRPNGKRPTLKTLKV